MGKLTGTDNNVARLVWPSDQCDMECFSYRSSVWIVLPTCKTSFPPAENTNKTPIKAFHNKPMNLNGNTCGMGTPSPNLFKNSNDISLQTMASLWIKTCAFVWLVEGHVITMECRVILEVCDHKFGFWSIWLK